VAPTWELNIETYGYGKRRKTYDPDYEHIESAKFKEYERLETQGYQEEVRGPFQRPAFHFSVPKWRYEVYAHKYSTFEASERYLGPRR
jgi:hypothetical protein